MIGTTASSVTDPHQLRKLFDTVDGFVKKFFEVANAGK